MRTRLAAIAAMLVWSALAVAQQPAKLNSPYAIERQRAIWGDAVAAKPCPPPPVPTVDIRAHGSYGGSSGSTVDPEKQKANLEAVRPVRLFTGQIVSQADAWARSTPPLRDAASCGLTWLDAWAQGGAMLGVVTQLGGYERKWALGGIALAYLKLRDAPGLDEAAKRRVEDWLAKLAHTVMPAYERANRKDSQNNHSYWAGLAVAAAGIAANDRALFDWGVARYRAGIDRIQPDGTLPLEVARGSLARYYHLFSAAPLVMIAELGAANGLDLYGEKNGALRRLVARTVSSIDDPAYFDRLTQRPQTTMERLSGAPFAWLEPYVARFPDPEAIAVLARFRPVGHGGIGGDTTRAFGRKDLPAR